MTAGCWPTGSPSDGSEQSVLHLMEVASGALLADRIPGTRAAELAWLPDATGFYYTRYPAAGEVPADEAQYHRAIYFHRLGADPAADPLIFKPARKEHWPGVSLSADGRWLVVSVARTFDQTDVYLQDRGTGGPLVSGGARPAIRIRCAGGALAGCISGPTTAAPDVRLVRRRSRAPRA